MAETDDAAAGYGRPPDPSVPHDAGWPRVALPDVEVVVAEPAAMSTVAADSGVPPSVYARLGIAVAAPFAPGTIVRVS
ncbi:MAG: hypothetical protein ACLFRD_08460 [Nitriliruptoraceae bacterium]